MSEYDSKRRGLDDVESAGTDTGSTPSEPKAAVVPLSRAGRRYSAERKRNAPQPWNPDDDDPGPAAA